MSDTGHCPPPASLVSSGRVVETTDGAGWAFVPRSLPPRVDSAEVETFTHEADRALQRYSREVAGFTRQEACERFFPAAGTEGEIEAIRQGREPWRNRTKEYELYIEATRPNEPLASLLVPSKLGSIHRDLVDDGEIVTQRFFRPGLLREGSAALTRSDGQVELVHPPHDWIENLLAQLASYIEVAERENIHPLIVASALHYQIVAIHPFTDGNGRLARFLSELWLIQTGAVSPALPLTQIFRRHYAGYLARLAGVTLYEDWNKWIRFFCAAIIHEITEALNSKPARATLASTAE